MADKCEHGEWVSKVHVNKRKSTGTTTAEVEVWCKKCKQPYEFIVDSLASSNNGTMITVQIQEHENG